MIPDGARVHYPGSPDDQGTAEICNEKADPVLVVLWDTGEADHGPAGDLTGRLLLGCSGGCSGIVTCRECGCYEDLPVVVALEAHHPTETDR